MIYVEILGRMGNQMFSYAAARKLQMELPRQQKQKIAFDFSNFSYLTSDWKNDLTHYVCNENIIEERRKLSFIQRGVLWLYFKKRNALKVRNESDIYELEKKWQDILNIFGIYLCSFNYHKFKFKPITKNILLLGYFESAEFFADIDEVIKNEYKPIELNYSNSILELMKKIEIKESICVGVRRGDFVASYNKEFCEVCTIEYYNNAIKKIEERVEDSYFFFFTDDSEWVKQNINVPKNAEIIEDKFINLVNYDKLYLMSNCKYFIISNSTFEWWAQHLSENKEKIVIAPDRWRNITPETHTGIYEEKGWITITTKSRDMLREKRVKDDN